MFPEMLRVLTHYFMVVKRPHTLKKFPLPGDELLIPDTPESSTIDLANLEDVPEFDHKLITHLERLSLVRFSDEEAVANLRKSVQIATKLQAVNVEGIQPMQSVWEDQSCPLRDDVPVNPLSAAEALLNAAKICEDYFVTPPGNVPLEAVDKLDLKLINEWDKLGQTNTPHPRKINKK